MIKRLLAAIGLGTILFLVNHAGVIAGVLHPPPGYEPLWFTRDLDIAQYLTWMALAKDHWLLPDYHAPWRTEGALFQPLFEMVGRSGLPVRVAYYLFDILCYWAASLGLIEAARVFCKTRRQMFYAALMVLCAVPLKLLGYVLAQALHWPDAVRLYLGAGLIEYVLNTSDGLARGGLSNSPTLTFGTAIMLFSFVNLAKFVATERRANYYWLAGLVFFGALLHPFEIFVIVVAAVWPLLTIRRWWESAALFVAAGVGMIPYLVQSVRSDWVRDASDLAQWKMGTPVYVLVVYGMPAILLCWLLLVRFKMERPEDQVLESWFLTTMFLPLIPALPGAMHLFDGFVYCTAILLVRKAQQDKLLSRLFQQRPRIMRGMLTATACASLVALFVAYSQIYEDGKSADPGLLSAVAPKAEVAMIEWMKDNLPHGDDRLVLAPGDMAPWVAGIPMPSLGSHYLFSITYDAQCELAARFYQGQDVRRELLDSYGVSYVVVPQASTVLMDGAELLHTEGNLKLYLIPGQTMKPYPSSARLVAAQRNGFRQWLFSLFRS
ncbi:MAG: hypothetical protein ABSF22_25395 [Bryobacteraceae bacterium]